MNKCEKCGLVLDIVRWSSGKEMALCCNDKCPAYRNPINPVSKRNWGVIFTVLTPYNHRITLSADNNYAPEDFVTVSGDWNVTPHVVCRSSKLNRRTPSYAGYVANQPIPQRIKKIFYRLD